VRISFERLGIGVPVLVFAAMIMLCADQARAQVAGATLSGTVRDSSGAVIPSAEVSITDVATRVTRQVRTDSSGFYVAPNLLPANYEVAVTAAGFSRELRTGITLTVGAQQLLDITMQVGQVNQTIQVTGEAPTVQLTSSTISAEVNATTVRELPLNGRSWTDLTNLQPGVVSAETHGALDQNRGFGAQVSISGGRPQLNNYRLDGISINDYANGGPGSVLGGNLGVDAIQEFSVLTSNYSAEYGKTAGGVVNAITRSGTNQFHGSLYEFLRNSALDARNFFDGATVPPFKRNQFGISAGAPIRKDRTFIFGDFESIRQSLGITRVNQVLSPAARLGQLSTGTVAVDPKVAAFLALEPLPNAGLINPDVGKFNFAAQQVVNENFFTIRADEKLSEKDSLFGTYSYDNSPLTQPDLLGNTLATTLAKRQIAAIEETHVFSPSFINTVRLGYNRAFTRAAAATQILNPAVTDPALMWSTSVGTSARILPFGGLSTIAPTPKVPGFQYVWNAYQIYDDAFVSKGSHSIKFGGTFENDQMNALTTTGDFVGTFSFSTLSTFLTNKPSRVRGVIPSAITPRYMRTSIFGAYIQDDWRMRPNLTVNLGLRYEMSTGITENKGKLTNLPTIDAATPRLGAPYFSNPTLRNFEPRVGFSWDPFHTGKTAVRGGFGVFDVLPLLYTTITLNGRGAPFFSVVSTSKLPQGSFPDTAINSVNKSTLEYAYVEPNPKRDYVMQWNLNIQREILRDLTATIGYVGSHGVHQLFRIDDANIVLPTLTSAGYLWPVVADPSTIVKTGAPSPVPATPVNSSVGAIRFVDWGGSSFYDGLQLGIQKRMSHGLQLQGSFTWGKSIDNNSGAIAGDTLSNSVTSLFWPDLRVTRAVSDYNIGRVLVINGTWLVPSSKATGPLGWAANGWQFGAIIKANDGVPITPTFGNGGDPLGLNSSDPFDFPNLVTGPGCSSLINPRNVSGYIKTQCFTIPTAPDSFFTPNAATPMCSSDTVFGGNKVGVAPQCFNLRGNAGRNIIVGPGLLNLDFSVFKNNYVRRISETFNAQFRMEVFNILNRANFQVPGITNDNIFSPTGSLDPSAGLLLATTTSAREIQFALKFMW
jgi:outer membrane receptor protein involved in Fe transport